MRSIKANTAEQYRDSLVSYLKQQSINKSIDARIAEGKTKQKELKLKSDWYMMQALFFERLPIEKF